MIFCINPLAAVSHLLCYFIHGRVFNLIHFGCESTKMMVYSSNVSLQIGYYVVSEE